MGHKLAVITVVYQNYEVLKDFFSSFRKQTNSNFKLFIVDLSDKKKVISNLDSRFLILNSFNKGYAHGVNQGIKKAISQSFNKFCVINNDTYVQNDFIHKSLSSIINHESSLIGGKIYYAHGFEYHKKRYQSSELGKVIWYACGEIDWKNINIKHIGVDEEDRGQFDTFKETDFITGCLVCFDKKVIDKVGFWDEKYFLYYEDADYCVRANRKGIKLYYDPSIIIWHKNAQSTGGSGSNLHQKYQKKNRMKFALKYAPIKTKLHILYNYLKGI